MLQPLEDGQVTIARNAMSLTYPAPFMLVAAMNPCPYGYAGEPVRPCNCSHYQVQRYQGRISRPIMDRIDIRLEVPAVRYEDLQSNNPAESSSSIRDRIVEARRKQRERFQQEGLYANALMRPWHIRKYCQLDESEERILRQAIERPGLSARAYHDPAAKTLDVFSRASSQWILSGTYVEDDKVRAEPFREIEIELGNLWVE